MAALIGALRVDMFTNVGEFNRGVKKQEAALKRFQARAKAVAATLAGAFSGAGFLSGLSGAAAAFAKQREAMDLVTASVEHTGTAAGRTAKQLFEAASAMQDVTKFGDEDILQKVTNNLLTFGNISGTVFDRAQEAALDLSAVLRQDLQSSAIQLGKALNDPVRGVTALSRVGITFTDSQRNLIKELVNTNRTLDAQKLILTEIEKLYGTAAETAGQSLSGVMTRAANDMGDAWEAVGEVIAPAVRSAAELTSTLAKGFGGLSLEMRTMIIATTGAAVSLGTIAASAAILGAALSVVTVPIAATVGALALLSGTIIANWRGISNVASEVGSSFQTLYQSAKDWLLDKLQPIITRLGGLFAWVGEQWRTLMAGFGAVADATGITATYKMISGETVKFVDQLVEVWNRGSDKINDAQKKAGIVTVKGQYQDLTTAVIEANNRIKTSQDELLQNGVAFTEGMQSPYQQLIQNQKGLDAALAAGKINAQEHANAHMRAGAMMVGAYAGYASDIMSTLGGIFEGSKAFAIAQSIINSLQAFTKALSAYPPPWNYAAAAATLAAGMAKVATIKSTNSTSRSAPTGGGGDGTAGTAGVAGTQAGNVQQISINLEGDSFGPQQIENLISNINNSVGNGVELVATRMR